jgi:AP2 domain
VADPRKTTIEPSLQEEFWDCVSLLLIGGGATLVDADVFESLLGRQWSVAVKNGAVYARAKDFLHRVICNPPQGIQIDHRNGDGLDNRRKNLRASSCQQNQWNAGPQPGRKCRFKGVTQTRQGKWKARIRYGGGRHYLGIFGSEEDAARAYDEAALIHHREFARLNLPRDSRPALGLKHASVTKLSREPGQNDANSVKLGEDETGCK